MKKIDLPNELYENIWVFGPYINPAIRFWYGETKTKSMSLSPEMLNIYFVNGGYGRLYVSGEDRNINLSPHDCVILDKEHKISVDGDSCSLNLLLLRTQRPKFKNFTFIHARALPGKWLIGNWIGSPIQYGHLDKEIADSEKEDVPHYHKKMQEGYLTKEGVAVLRVNNDEIELTPNSLVLVDPFEEHAITAVKQSIYRVDLFNYPSTPDDKFPIK